MPTISWFYGIAIRMYIKDHAPPHFDAVYGGDEAYISIETGEVIQGRMRPSAARLIREWTEARKALLLENWKRAQAGEPLERIPGLDAD